MTGKVTYDDISRARAAETSRQSVEKYADGAKTAVAAVPAVRAARGLLRIGQLLSRRRGIRGVAEDLVTGVTGAAAGGYLSDNSHGANAQALEAMAEVLSAADNGVAFSPEQARQAYQGVRALRENQPGLFGRLPHRVMQASDPEDLIGRNTNWGPDAAFVDAAEEALRLAIQPRRAQWSEQGQATDWLAEFDREREARTEQRRAQARVKARDVSSMRPDDVHSLDSIRPGTETNAGDVIGDKGGALRASHRRQREQASERDRSDGAPATPRPDPQDAFGRGGSLAPADRAARKLIEDGFPKSAIELRARKSSLVAKRKQAKLDLPPGVQPTVPQIDADPVPGFSSSRRIAEQAVGADNLAKARDHVGRRKGEPARSALDEILDGPDPTRARNAAFEATNQWRRDRDKGDDEETDQAIAEIPSELSSTEEISGAMRRKNKKGKPFYGASETYRSAVRSSIETGFGDQLAQRRFRF